METTVVSEDGPACDEMYVDYSDLALMPRPSPYENAVFIGFADTYNWYGRGVTSSDVLLVGHRYTGSVPYLYPGFWDSDLATVSYADGELEWSHDSNAASGVTLEIDGHATVAF